MMRYFPLKPAFFAWNGTRPPIKLAKKYIKSGIRPTLALSIAAIEAKMQVRSLELPWLEIFVDLPFIRFMSKTFDEYEAYMRENESNRKKKADKFWKTFTNRLEEEHIDREWI